jgi:hypothetical protein
MQTVTYQSTRRHIPGDPNNLLGDNIMPKEYNKFQYIQATFTNKTQQLEQETKDSMKWIY